MSPCVGWSIVYQNHHFTFSFLYKDNIQLNVECAYCEQEKIYRELKFSNNTPASNCAKYSFIWPLLHIFLNKIYMLQHTPELKMTRKAKITMTNVQFRPNQVMQKWPIPMLSSTKTFIKKKTQTNSSCPGFILRLHQCCIHSHFIIPVIAWWRHWLDSIYLFHLCHQFIQCCFVVLKLSRLKSELLKILSYLEDLELKMCVLNENQLSNISYIIPFCFFWTHTRFILSLILSQIWLGLIVNDYLSDHSSGVWCQWELFILLYFNISMEI